MMPLRKRLRTTSTTDNNMEDTVKALVDSHFSSMTATITALSTLLPSLPEPQQAAFNTLIKTLTDSTGRLRETLNHMSTRQQTTTTGAEELERQRSLVIIGLPESTATTPSKRLADDKAQMNCLLDGLEIECEPTCIYRMGRKPNPARNGEFMHPRLVKVVLPSRQFQRTALANWKSKRPEIRQPDTDFARLLIRPSLTPAQLAADREKRAQARTDRHHADITRPTGPNAMTLFQPAASLIANMIQKNP